ncbi:MAG: hypothetical protein FWE61_01565 [Micrococcales bacterium]|nr:hypothetical protein [Micrococcales bacterium]
MTSKQALLGVATNQEAAVRLAREVLESAVAERNETVKALRAAGASYGEIANALGLTRAGAVGICRKIMDDS